MKGSCDVKNRLSVRSYCNKAAVPVMKRKNWRESFGTSLVPTSETTKLNTYAIVYATLGWNDVCSFEFDTSTRWWRWTPCWWEKWLPRCSVQTVNFRGWMSDRAVFIWGTLTILVANTRWMASSCDQRFENANIPRRQAWSKSNLVFSQSCITLAASSLCNHPNIPIVSPSLEFFCVRLSFQIRVVHTSSLRQEDQEIQR